MQQTPNPEAHVPVAVPPLAEHSADVKHVPLSPVVVLQPELGNRTTENSEITTSERTILFIGSVILINI